MKRKIIAVAMTLLMLLGVVGCSTEGLSLYGEMKKTSAWESSESSGKMLVTTEVGGEKFELGADFSGYANTKETQAYVEMNIHTVKFSSMNLDVKMSPVKVYVDGQTIYISKTYFTELMQLSGSDVPEALKNIDAKYIGIDANTGSQVASFNQAQAINLMDVLFKDSNIKVPITQNGREYTIELNADQMVDLSVQFIKEVMNNIDEINKISDTGVTQKDVDQEKETLELTLEQGKEMVKPMLDGSKVKIKYSFEDNICKENIDAVIKVAIAEAPITLNLNVASESKKSTQKDFKLPDSKKVYSMEEFMKLFVSAGSQTAVKAVSVEKNKLVVKNNETYVPLREVMTGLGYAVNYDAQTKKSSIKVGGQEAAVSTIVQKGSSYIALSELLKLGFETTVDESGMVIIFNRF